MTEHVSLGRKLLNGWLAVSGRFGFVQTLMILVLFYAALIGPFGLALAVARRDLLAGRNLRAPVSAWLDADTAEPDLERTKRQS